MKNHTRQPHAISTRSSICVATTAPMVKPEIKKALTLFRKYFGQLSITCVARWRYPFTNGFRNRLYCCKCCRN